MSGNRQENQLWANERLPKHAQKKCQNRIISKQNESWYYKGHTTYSRMKRGRKESKRSKIPHIGIKEERGYTIIHWYVITKHAYSADTRADT